LSAHYRSPIDFSAELLEQAKSGLDRILTCRENLEHYINRTDVEANGTEEDDFAAQVEVYSTKFIEAMDDDLNTADAISAIFELVKELNTALVSINKLSKKSAEFGLFVLNELCMVLGIAEKKEQKALDSEIEILIEKRQQARKEKNFKLSDEIRDKLKTMGIVLEDTPQGVKWSYQK